MTSLASQSCGKQKTCLLCFYRIWICSMYYYLFIPLEKRWREAGRSSHLNFLGIMEFQGLQVLQTMVTKYLIYSFWEKMKGGVHNEDRQTNHHTFIFLKIMEFQDYIKFMNSRDYSLCKNVKVEVTWQLAPWLLFLTALKSFLNLRLSGHLLTLSAWLVRFFRPGKNPHESCH